MPFQNIRAVLFDLDGTLIHTNIDFARMKHEALDLVRARGVDPEEFAGLDILSILSAGAERVEDPAAFREEAEALLTAIELDACEGAYPAEGGAETLEWLQAGGRRVGIVTRNCRAAVEILLHRVPLPHEVLLTRADTPRVKPDPLHLELALRRLDTAPREALMVGDHIMDVQGGKAAGMRTVGILNPDRPDDYFAPAQPDAVIRRLPELRAWISP